MSDTGRKKEYLNRYRKAKRLEKQCREDLAQAIINMRVPSVRMSDGMPHAHGGTSDLSDGMVGIEEYEERLSQRIMESRRIQIEVSDAIAEVGKVEMDEEAILRNRYMCEVQPSWEETAAAFHMSRRTACRLHGKALLHFTVPEEETEEEKDKVGTLWHDDV